MQRKVLKTGALTQEIQLDPEMGGTATVEYGATGEDGVTASAGTVVMEGFSGGAWFPLKIHKNDDTIVDNLVAPGAGWVETVSYEKIRARCSAGNTANGVTVYLNAKKG